MALGRPMLRCWAMAGTKVKLRGAATMAPNTSSGTNGMGVGCSSEALLLA